MAITVITGGTLGSGAINGGNVTLTLPTLATNDVVFVLAATQDRLGNNTQPVMSSTGWTLVEDMEATGSKRAHIWRKIMGGTPDTSVVITGTGSTQDGMAAVGICLRGVDLNALNDPPSGIIYGSSTNPDPGPILSLYGGSTLIAFAYCAINDTAITAPTNFTSGFAQGTASDTNAFSCAVGAFIGGGNSLTAVDPAAFTGWSTGVWGAITLSVKPSRKSVFNLSN